MTAESSVDYRDWKSANWKQRAFMVVLFGIGYGIVVPAMFVGALVVLGMMVEGVSESRMNLERCQKHAETPYEYHQCR